MKECSLKIGDNLYLFDDRLMEYKVIEVRQTEDTVMYVIECLTCMGHEPCKILIVESVTKGSYQFVQMLNNDDEWYWHQSNNASYYKNKNLALVMAYKKSLRMYQADLEKCKVRQDSLEQSIQKIKDEIKILEEQLG